MAKGLIVRRGACVAAALVLAGQWVLVAPSAEASASGCTAQATGGYGHSCVDVNGGGVHVNWARGGVKLGPNRDSKAGRFELTAGDFRHLTEDGVYTSGVTASTEWGPKVQVNRDFPHGTKFCASFWEGNGDGTYNVKSPACITIKR